MKTFSLMFLFCSIFLYSQKIKSLEGIENELGETILLYRCGTDSLEYNPVYKFNTSTLSEEIIINAGIGTRVKRGCNDFEFFPRNDSVFMNIGYEVEIDPIFFIARNDTIVQYDTYVFRGVDIDRQNPMRVYAFGNGIFRSFDGGLTFPPDSVLNTDYSPISLSRFEDNTFFGLSQESKLVKNGVLVDTSTIFFDSNFKIIYDSDNLHVYVIYKTYFYEGIQVSADKGNSFSLKYFTNSNLSAAVDPAEPGTIYAAERNEIRKSIDYGTNFLEYKELPYRIVGLYKKPGSEILYAATPGKIFAVTPDSIKVIKTMIIPPEEFDWFPLAIGNRWTFEDINCWPLHDTLVYVSTIIGDTLISGIKYFTFDKPLGINAYKWIRIDSANGIVEVYRYDYQYPIYDYFMETGDITGDYYLANDDSLMVFDKLRAGRLLYSTRPLGTFYHILIKGLGYYYEIDTDVGAWCHENKLKGCIVNGIVYGDTTVAGIEKPENIPAEYILYQNYPNPFNPVTNINYSIPSRVNVIIKIFDLLGREIITLIDEEKQAGNYALTWKATGLPGGVYFYQLKAGDYISTKKLILLK